MTHASNWLFLSSNICIKSPIATVCVPLRVARRVVARLERAPLREKGAHVGFPFPAGEITLLHACARERPTVRPRKPVENTRGANVARCSPRPLRRARGCARVVVVASRRRRRLASSSSPLWPAWESRWERRMSPPPSPRARPRSPSAGSPRPSCGGSGGTSSPRAGPACATPSRSRRARARRARWCSRPRARARSSGRVRIRTRHPPASAGAAGGSTRRSPRRCTAARPRWWCLSCFSPRSRSRASPWFESRANSNVGERRGSTSPSSSSPTRATTRRVLRRARETTLKRKNRFFRRPTEPGSAV